MYAKDDPIFSSQELRFIVMEHYDHVNNHEADHS